MDDVFDMLEADHRRVEQMLEQLTDSEQGPERERLVEQLGSSLELHMRFEEDSLYPLLASVDGEMAQEADNEHRLAREGLSQMRELVSQPGFGAAVEMVTAGISHHVEEEEGDAFPKLRESTDDSKIGDLTTTLQQMKSAAGLADGEADEEADEDLEDATKEELLSRAQEAGIEGRSQMTKDELRDALGESSA